MADEAADEDIGIDEPISGIPDTAPSAKAPPVFTDAKETDPSDSKSTEDTPDDEGDVFDEVPILQAAQSPSLVVQESEEEDLSDFMQSSGMGTKSIKDDLTKPWMKFHSFNLVKTVEEVSKIVDSALAHGRCGLDLETEGFDNRIEYDDQGRMYTRHKIVGYCISVRGVGYYIPVRHSFDVTYGEKNPNVPNEAVEYEIRRLCQASQPIIEDEAKIDDPLGSMRLVSPPRIVIYFWNAKFDQEFLFPVTGIDFWHPESFEDGMLAAYSVYSDDELGLKVNAGRRLTIYDPSLKNADGTPMAHRYEMIRFEDLFPKGMKRSEMKFKTLYPEEGSAIVQYGCSDAICTEILCEARKTPWAFAQKGLKFDFDGPVKKALEQPFYTTYRLEKQTTQAVRLIERTRAKIDKNEIVGLLAEAENELTEYEQKIVKLAENKGFKDFKPGSTSQLGDFLFGEQGLDIKPKPERNEASGQYKTDAATLESMVENIPHAPEVLTWIVKWRQIDKIIGTYLRSLSNNCDDDSCLRFKFVQTGAATGRFTAPSGESDHGYSGIPIQGIPAREDPKKPKVARSLRRMFVSREGYTFVKVDYAGQELRIVANLSREPKWVDEFVVARSEGREADLHTLTAQAFFGPHITKKNKLERDMGKIANFSLIYGGGTAAIQRATKCDKVEAARRKQNFDKSVPTFAKWVKGQHELVRKKLGVMTAFGRFLGIPDATARVGDVINGRPIQDEQEIRRIRAGCERKSTNYPIQGSGADILKISLVRLVKEFFKRGWLKTGGDDSVRLLMTVHDEVVFEIRHDRIQQAMPIIIAVMESPARMVSWKIPLVVEPLVGKNWDCKGDWLKIVKGEEAIPEWLEGHVVPGLKVEDVPEDPKPVPKELFTPNLSAAPKAEPKAEPLPEVEESEDVDLSGPPPSPTPKAASAPVVQSVPLTPRQGSVPPPAAKKPQSTQGRGRIVTFQMSNTYMTERSISMVIRAVFDAQVTLEDGGKTLRLIDATGNILVDPRLELLVDPDKFGERLADGSLGQATYDESDI